MYKVFLINFKFNQAEKKWINNCFLLKWENLYNLQIQQNFIDSNIKGGKNRQ